jgi:hypothetical protein
MLPQRERPPASARSRSATMTRVPSLATTSIRTSCRTGSCGRPAAISNPSMRRERVLEPDSTKGRWRIRSTIHGFVRRADGDIGTFDAPGAGTGAFQGTFAASINAEGEITGYTVDGNNVSHGFLRSRSGAFSLFDVPVASTASGEGTAPFSINLGGAVTGEFLDENSAMHGFSRSPRGSIVTFDAPGAGAAAAQGTRPSTNNSAGEVTGWYVDADNVGHGFLAKP